MWILATFQPLKEIALQESHVKIHNNYSKYRYYTDMPETLQNPASYCLSKRGYNNVFIYSCFQPEASPVLMKLKASSSSIMTDTLMSRLKTILGLFPVNPKASIVFIFLSMPPIACELWQVDTFSNLMSYHHHRHCDFRCVSLHVIVTPPFLTKINWE